MIAMFQHGPAERCDACLNHVTAQKVFGELWLCDACRSDPLKAADLIEARDPRNETGYWYQMNPDKLRTHVRNGRTVPIPSEEDVVAAAFASLTEPPASDQDVRDNPADSPF